MTEKEIASAILNRRNSLSPIVMQGEMRDVLGAGYETALNNRWLVANHESGELQINTNAATLEQMRKVSEAVVPPAAGQSSDPEIGDTVMVADEGQSFQATVAGKNADGTFQLSFGDKKPKQDRYPKDRVKMVQKAQPKPGEAPPPPPAGQPSTGKPAPNPARGYTGPVSPAMR